MTNDGKVKLKNKPKKTEKKQVEMTCANVEVVKI